MKHISTVLVAGAGSIGSMVAAQINKAGLPVSLLAGGERRERYRSEGLVINGERFDFDLVQPGSRRVFDLVIIACKNHHLLRVLADLDGLVGEDTLIISLLNGISSETETGAVYGRERIPYAMIIGTDAGHAANVTTWTTTGTIFFGDAHNADARENWSPRVAAIAEFFDRAEIRYSVPADMLNRLWYKYMLNVGVNQVTAILRRPYRAIQSATVAPETRALLDEAMREVIAVAKAEGIELGDDDIASVYRTMDLLDPEGKTSMCQDVEAGRKTEVELFSGTVMSLGKRHGIPVPVNAVFWKLLRSVETSY